MKRLIGTGNSVKGGRTSWNRYDSGIQCERTLNGLVDVDGKR